MANKADEVLNWKSKLKVEARKQAKQNARETATKRRQKRVEDEAVEAEARYPLQYLSLTEDSCLVSKEKQRYARMASEALQLEATIRGYNKQGVPPLEMPALAKMGHYLRHNDEKGDDCSDDDSVHAWERALGEEVRLENQEAVDTSLEELEASLEEIVTIDASFRGMDVNHDGVIDRDEFEAGFNPRPNKPRIQPKIKTSFNNDEVSEMSRSLPPEALVRMLSDRDTSVIMVGLKGLKHMKTPGRPLHERRLKMCPATLTLTLSS